MQKSKYVFVFLELSSAKNKSASESAGKVFLMIKTGPGFMGSLVYSHKVVVALSATWMTEILTWFLLC
jgi:hypothetical protein